MKALLIKQTWPLASALVVFIVYMITLAPAVQQIDGGELAAVMYSGGIAHPTGYPLFSLLGFVWSCLNPGFTAIVWLNAFSALNISIGVFFFHKTTFLFLQRVTPNPDTKRKPVISIVIPDKAAHWFSVAIAMMIGFSRTIWLQSTAVEVYALHILCLSIIFFTTLKAVSRHRNSWKNWFPVAIAVGLSFGNHLSTLMIVPGILLLYFLESPKNISLLKNGLILITIGAATATFIYLWLPIRSSMQPMMDWGNPETWENFRRHVSGWQFQEWLFSDAGARDKNLQKFQGMLWKEFSILGIVLAGLGLIEGFLHHKKLLVFLVVHFACCLLLAVNYAIKDLETYFLLSFIVVGFLVTWAVLFAWRYIRVLREKPALSAFALLLPGIVCYSNFQAANRSDWFVFEDYSGSALASLPEDALVITRAWDIFASPVFYLQLVKKQRPDVLMVEKELLRRSWYLDQLERWDSKTTTLIQPEKEALYKALKPFERKEKYDGSLIQSKFQDYITQLIDKSYPIRPVYIGAEIIMDEIQSGRDVILPRGMILVPQRYFYRLSKSDLYQPLEAKMAGNIRFPASFDPYRQKEETDLYAYMVWKTLADLLLDRIFYELSFEKLSEAQQLKAEFHQLCPKSEFPESLEAALQKLSLSQHGGQDTLK